jgi:hypothetical protein
MTEEKVMTNIKNMTGKRINSAPSPMKVHPSTFVSSGSPFNFPKINGIASNEKIRIETRKIFWREIEK